MESFMSSDENQFVNADTHKNKCIHIFCYHGLGDVIRFAIPVAHAFHRSGAEVFLHTRSVLASTIGQQPEGINIAAVTDDFVSSNGGAEKAMQILFAQLPKPNLAIGLGGSFFDVEAAKFLQRNSIDYWGGKCDTSNPNFDASISWLNTMEVDKSRNKLFRLLRLPNIDPKEVLINPQPIETFTLPEGTVGLHTKAMWPSRCYNQGPKLLELLKNKYNVWNFDNPPCKSIADLACHIKQSKAVLSVDTMVIHLCNALNVPSLMIQGPVWHHPDNAPNVIEFTRTTKAPISNHQIDKQSDELSKIAPERIMKAFEFFLDKLD